VHQGVRQELLEADAKSLQGAVQTLVDWYCRFNFGPEVPVPSFEIDYESPEDLTSRVQRDKVLLVDMRLPVAKRWLYETYGIPEPAEGEELLEPPTGDGQAGGGQAGGPALFAEGDGSHPADPVIDAAMDDVRGFYAALRASVGRRAQKKTPA